MNDLNPTRVRDAALQAGRVQYRAEHGRWPSRSWKLEPTAPAPAGAVKSPERESFDLAYGDKPITPEAAVWSEDSRYMRWQLTTHYAGSRLAFNRNHPNG